MISSNGAAVHNHWYLVSSHGSVLFYVAIHPGCTIREMADELVLTERTIWGLVGDLRRAGMLSVRREGHRHHYTVNLDADFRHPVMRSVSLRVILGELVARYAGRKRETSVA